MSLGVSISPRITCGEFSNVKSVEVAEDELSPWSSIEDGVLVGFGVGAGVGVGAIVGEGVGTGVDGEVDVGMGVAVDVV